MSKNKNLDGLFTRRYKVYDPKLKDDRKYYYMDASTGSVQTGVDEANATHLTARHIMNAQTKFEICKYYKTEEVN